MTRVLLIEDDESAARAVEKSLAWAGGFVLSRALRLDNILAEILDFKPELILLDIGLGAFDGRDILKKIRANALTQDIPVIFLTGRSQEKDKALGLDLGGDDYVVKPFGALELLARIHAVLRRGRFVAARAKPNRGLYLDAHTHQASLDGKPLRLRPREFDILLLLLSQRGRILSRLFLIERTSAYTTNVSPRSLDAHIKNIRKKMGNKGRWIETVPKIGYRLSDS